MRQVLLGVLLMAACASTPAVSSEHQVYFALELRREGRLLAMPKLLGQTGKTVRAERRQPGAAIPDYQLKLDPKFDGERYQVGLEVKVPDVAGNTKLDIRHGQIRTVELGSKPGQLQVQLLLMRVDSPEFRALMQLTETEGSAAPHI
jgi:hypothetical protein